MRTSIVFLQSLFALLTCNVDLSAQLVALPKMVEVNDSLLVGKYEITNAEFRIFFESQNDSVQKIIEERRQMFFLQYRNGGEFAMSDIEVYSSHPYYSNYPYIGINDADALLYVNWLQKQDSSKKYFLPNRLDYLSVYSIPHEEALLHRYLCGPPLRDKQLLEATIDSGGTFNRDYFPWGTSLYGRKKQIQANLFVPVEYRILEKKWLSGRRELKRKQYNYYSLFPVGTMPFNYKGIYDLQGNVSELLFETNYTFGGSYDDQASAGYIGRVTIKKAIPFDVGFRVFATKIK